MTQTAGELRKAALDSSLADFEAQGFRIESRTEVQAILVRRSRLAWLGRSNGSRLVVWVDEHGAVETRPIDARRW
jgi:hypothetical protein